MTGPLTSREALTATEQEFLEDNIATVAFHLGQPGARMSVTYENGARLAVDPGEVLKEISRRLSVAQTSGWQPIELVPERTEAVIFLYFLAEIVGAYKRTTLPAMYRTGHPRDFPNREPSHFMLIWPPVTSTERGSK